MNIREIEYVLAVVKEGSISRAAQTLYMAQSTLSQAIQALECELGCKLFNRSGNRIHLTYAGERFIESGMQILKLYRDMENEMYDIAHLKKGSINIGLPTFMGAYLFPKFGPHYINNYPGISVNIVEESSLSLERGILSGKIDIAVIPLPVSSSAIYYEPLFQNRMVVAISADNPLCAFSTQNPGERFPTIDLHMLADSDFFMSTGKKMELAVYSIFKKASISPNVKFLSRDIENLKNLAESSMGFTILPEYHFDLPQKSTSLNYYYIDKQYDYPWIVVFAYRKGSYLSAAAEELLKLLKNNFR